MLKTGQILYLLKQSADVKYNDEIAFRVTVAGENIIYKIGTKRAKSTTDPIDEAIDDDVEVPPSKR